MVVGAPKRVDLPDIVSGEDSLVCFLLVQLEGMGCKERWRAEDGISERCVRCCRQGRQKAVSSKLQVDDALVPGTRYGKRKGMFVQRSIFSPKMDCTQSSIR
jgi:hypothetical protein